MTVAVSKPSPFTAQGTPLLSARKQLDIVTAYREVGTFRGAAEICGVTHKTVKRTVERDESGEARAGRGHNYEGVRGLVAGKVEDTKGKISAKRLLPAARAAGYAGSARNFRRLVAQEKAKYRRRLARERSRRPAVWSPGEYLVIDWGVQDGLHVFCAVLAHSRVRFVRFAADERAQTTMAMLAECFATLGGVPKVVLADRMACLKGGVVADVVIPTPDYVRFATHYRFRPDFCHAHDPASKGIVENLVGYAKRDLMVPLATDGVVDLAAANTAAAAWCAEVNTARHSEIAAVPAERFASTEAQLLAPLPSLTPAGVFGGRRELRKVDKLSCVRFGSARYSVPNRHLGATVEVVAGQDRRHDPHAGHRGDPRRAPVDGTGRGLRPRRPLRAATTQHPGPEGHSENRCRTGVLRARAGRGTVAALRGSLREHPVGTRARRARRAAGRARTRRAGRGAAAGDHLRPVAGQRGPRHPRRRCWTPTADRAGTGSGDRATRDRVAVTGGLPP